MNQTHIMVDLPKIKNYTIKRKICRKICFTLYDVVNNLDNQRRFLKVLNDELGKDENTGLHFLNTALVSGQLQSDDICKTYRYGREKRYYLIDSEAIDWMPLSLYIHEEFPFPLKKVASILIKIARVLRKAHFTGLAHGLLNPGSIYIAEDGRIKIDDFGYHWIASHLSKIDETEATYLSYYMAPEFFAEGLQIDGRADIYSLGVILLQLLTDEISQNGGSALSKNSSLNVSLSSLRHFYPEFYEDLERILKLCLNRDTERRYFNLSEFTKDLKSLSAKVAANSKEDVNKEPIQAK